MASVTLDRVRKVYDGGIIAVHDVSIEVGAGEFVVLVGPSGCGKSTTLRMIAGLESITAGEVRIGDRVVNAVPPKDRDIAMVFQNYALYPHMTVRENMAFALKLRNVPRAEIDRRMREAAAILAIEELLDRKPRHLSGGQRQRVAVGRAIVRQPRAFLFDEPLSNLDARLRVQMRKEISRLHRQLGATMIYVTHDQVEAMTMGDRIVVMHEGRVRQIGAPADVYERPADTFVAGFIGSPPMNLWRGHVRGDGGASVFEARAGGLRIPLDAPVLQRLGLASGGEVVLGLRPEGIHLGEAPFASGACFGIDARLDEAEPMGNEIFLYASAGGQEIVARVPPQPVPRPGDPVRLTLDLDRLHAFEAATGVRLGP
ncbi:MAG TPA: sn-glycerol-3-phosphate ABC transporter ATP-binding protein UgpC [Longimicrobiales bacterium]